MFSVKNLQINRGRTTASAQGKDTSVIHTYIDEQTTVANIKLYFPPFLDQGANQEDILLLDYMFVTGSDTAIMARILSLDPFVVDIDLFSGAAGLSVGAPIAPVDNNAAKITAGILQMEIADQTHNGIMSTAPQDFGGEKTFHANINIIDPVNGLTIQKTIGSFGVQLVTSDPNAVPGFSIGDTGLPGMVFGLIYKRTGFATLDPELYLIAGNNAGVILNDTLQTVTIFANLLSDNLDTRTATNLDIGLNNATSITLHKQVNITAGNNINVDEVDVFTPGTLKIGGTDTTDVSFPKPVSFATPGGTPALLNDYEEYDHVSTFSLNTETSGSTTFRFVRVGDAVTVTNKTVVSVPGQGAPGPTFSTDTLLPARFRPTNDTSGFYIVTNNGISSGGAINITAAGSIDIYNNADFTTAFTAAVTNGFDSGSFAYSLN